MGFIGNLLGRGAEQLGGKLGAQGGRAIAGFLGRGDAARQYATTGADVGRNLGGRVGDLLRRLPFKKGGVVKRGGLGKRRRMKRTVVRRRR